MQRHDPTTRPDSPTRDRDPRVAPTSGWERSGHLLLVAALAATIALLARHGGTPAPHPHTRQGGPLATVEVDARQPWQSTGVTVEAGTTLRIAVTAGMWTYWLGHSIMQPGTGDDYICANIMPAERCVEPMPHERKGALIGRIGGGRLFLIGQRRDLAAEESGLLELRINDPEHALWDNDGVLTVEIGALEAPPDITTTASPGPTAAPYPGPTEAPYPGPGTAAPPSAPTASVGPPRVLPTPGLQEPPAEAAAAEASAGSPGEAPAATAGPVPRSLPRTGGGGMAR